MIATTKTCTKCGQEKDIEEFHKSKNGKYGRRSHCKTCTSAYKKKYSQKMSSRVITATTKVCSKCGKEKGIEEFYRHRGSKDGRQGWCKACSSAYRKEYNQKMSSRIVIATTKTCSKCRQEKDIEEFYRNRGSKNGRDWYCKACKSAYYKEYKKEYNKRKYREMSPLERSAYNMACGVLGRTGANGKYTKKGIKNLLGNRAEIERFLLENFSQDIQAILDKGETPSIDRIDPKGHYEPGNVRVIPHRLNSKLANQER